MTAEAAILFDGRKASAFLRSQWVAKGALQPLSTAELLEEDRSANKFFRGLWPKAFPDRRTLPFEPLAAKDGTGTTAFWEVWR